MLLRILLSGDGGQGIQLISDIICRAAMENDLEVTNIPNYGLEQRGGVSLAYLKVSDEEIVYPKFSHPDILLIMSDQARERTHLYHKANYVIDIKEHLDVLATQKLPKQSYNIYFLGVLANVLEGRNICDHQVIYKMLEEKLNKKPGWEENKKAFNLGLSF